MPVDWDNIRIAVVDDDKNILNVFSSLISQAKLYADFFSSSADAYKAIVVRPKRYDLLITDIYMPSGDGIVFARKIREILPDIPVLFMTGNVTEERKQEALSLGRVQFLEKPFPLVNVLRDTLAAALTDR